MNIDPYILVMGPISVISRLEANPALSRDDGEGSEGGKDQ